MKIAALIALALAMGQAAPAVAADQAGNHDPLEGLYVANMMETASQLYLGPDEGFQWGFSMGALDLFAEGRWRRDGENTIILTTLPPVTPPGFELAATGRDDRPGLRVRLDEASATSWPYLDVEAEYADGTRARESFQGPAHVFSGDRRIVALRLGSAPFDFQSPPFPVDPAVGNVLTFHFLPNDIGLADFREQRVVLEPGGLSFEWRGTRLRYEGPVQLEAQEAMPDEAEIESVMTGPVVPIRAGPILPWDVQEGAPSVGLYDISLGEAFEATAARSTFPFRPEAGLGNDFADGVAEMRIRWGDRVYDAGRISDLNWYVNDRGGVPYVKAIGFSHEDRLLDLHEALARARALRDWLEQAGFTLGGPPDTDERPPFSLIHPYRYDEQVAGWAEAEAVLADADSGVQGLDLYRMRAGGWYATVSVINYSRVSGRPAGDPVRQWDLQVGFDSDLDPVPLPEGGAAE